MHRNNQLSTVQDSKLVSDSFRAAVMLDDTDVSEGYDSDCYFQDLTKPPLPTEPEDHQDQPHPADTQAEHIKMRLQDSAMFEALLEDQGSFATFFNYEDTVDNPLERDI